MRKELEKRLLHSYPALFGTRSLALGQYRMRWGFECGDGWFDLINTLCSNLQYRTDRAGAPQVHISQVKSKLGTLRVNFIGSGDEYAHGMRHMALAFSELICEECGATSCQLNHTPN